MHENSLCSKILFVGKLVGFSLLIQVSYSWLQSQPSWFSDMELA